MHAYNPALPLIFLHIPKSAGEALTAGLKEALGPRHTVRGFDRVLFGGFDAFDTFAPHERKRVYLNPSELPADADFVSAHMAFSTFLARFGGSANFVTVLREPMCRLLSNWLFWRATSDEYLKGVGEWANYVKQARRPFRDFLSCEAVACHTDNLIVRMLLWPHRLISDEHFIDSHHDETIVYDALGQLSQFGFADVIENPRMLDNLHAWLHRRVICPRINETTDMPGPLRRYLESELTNEAITLMEARSRLDARLWALLAGSRIPGMDPETLRQGVVLRDVARYARLMTD